MQCRRSGALQTCAYSHGIAWHGMAWHWNREGKGEGSNFPFVAFAFAYAYGDLFTSRVDCLEISRHIFFSGETAVRCSTGFLPLCLLGCLMCMRWVLRDLGLETDDGDW